MDQLTASLGLSWSVIQDRLAVMRLSEVDRDGLRAVASDVEAGADGFIERLYAHLTESAGTAGWFTRPATVARLKPLQRRYLTELFTARIDWPYVERRLQIGVAHHRVRLTPRWYVATCAHFLCEHVPLLAATAPSTAEFLDRLVALTSTMLFDASLVLDAYGMSLEDSMRSDCPESPLHGGEGGDGGSAPIGQPAAVGSPNASLARMRLTNDDCGERQRFLGIDDTTVRTLRDLEPDVRRALPAMLEDFYAVFRAWPRTAPLLQEGVVQRLLQQVSSYWLELARADFSRPYASSRTRIGIVHERIGVAPQLYLVGLARQLGSLLRAICVGHADPARVAVAVLRAVFYDVSFILDAYMDARAASVLKAEGYAAQLLASLTVGVAVLDPTRRVRSANPALLQLLGCDASIVRHMSASDLVPDPRVGDILDRVAADPRQRGCIQVPFGGRHLRVTAVQMDAVEDTAARTLALLVDDVTDLVVLAPEVDSNERRLVDALTSSDFVLWEADAETWLLSMISSPVHGLTGYRDVHYLGRHDAWLGRFPRPDRDRFVECCTRLGLGERCALVHRLTHADGGERWVRTHVVRVGAAVGASVFRGVSMDVSASVLAEKRRIEAVGSLAGSVAHEFNGLLTVIAGSLGLLGEDADAAARVEIDAASAAVTRGASLTRRLQAFAQGAPLRLSPAVLNEVIRSIEGDLRQTVGAGVELAVDTEEPLWPCQIDAEQLGAALTNLVVNAREAMPFGGIVRIATRNIHARDILPAPDVGSFDDHVEVMVADSGSGMSQESRTRSVEPFFTTKGTAAGLGLSVVHGFVHQSRGHLVIESGIDQGTTVRLRFPRYHPSVPSESSGGVSPAKRKVVVVEDDRAVASMLERLLTRRGHAVRVAHSTDEARAAIAAERPDLVICDVVFAGEAAGAVLGRELRQTFPDIPLVYMSGYTKSALHLGAGELFLAKPFQLGELDALLGQVFPPK